MAILCISNGQSERETIKLLEGSVWEIDSYTMTLEDSNEVRIVNAEAYQDFQRRFPHAGRGSVRLFLPPKREGEIKEWLVFYRKHEIAFPKILSNINFMESYVEEGSRYFSYSDIQIIKESPSQIQEYMNLFCRKLLERDKKNGYNNGGPLYYGFMRDVLYRYLRYSKEHSNAPSIDQLYAEYYSEKRMVPNFVSDYSESTMRTVPIDSEIDPDHIIYDEMDRIEARYSSLQEFLGNPHFDRYYGDIFKDGYFFILGSIAKTFEQKEIYQKWYHYGENGFDGTIVCPAASKNLGYVDQFVKASIVFFIIFENDLEVDKMISLAIANNAEVAIHLYDASLYPKYAKKYPQATIFLPEMQEEDELLDATDEFMIGCYNHEKEKGLKKCETS